MKIEDYNEYYIQGSDHYLIPKDIFYEVFDEMENWKEEAKELKKQLEELKSTNKVLSEKLTEDKILKQDCLTTCCGIPIGDIPKLITQQKEFINFLEDNYKETQDIWYIKILQKYKSIIGGKDE